MTDIMPIGIIAAAILGLIKWIEWFFEFILFTGSAILIAILILVISERTKEWKSENRK